MPSPIHKIVMRRIYIIYVLGLVINTTALSVLVVVVALGAVTHVVHVGNVLANMPRLTSGVAPEHFLVSAFEHTKFITQVAVVSLLGAVSYFMYSAVSAFRAMRFTRTV
ncbi:MAG TPA: hypothetical protein ENI56_00050 [Candidatus Kaiserbacteria bacterium]|nr:hypothetical protein [Candidatus Kaiserbacteria bacterium]